MSIDATGSAQALPLAADVGRQALQAEQVTATRAAEEIAQASEEAAKDKQKVASSEGGRGAHVDVNV